MKQGSGVASFFGSPEHNNGKITGDLIDESEMPTLAHHAWQQLPFEHLERGRWIAIGTEKAGNEAFVAVGFEIANTYHYLTGLFDQRAAVEIVHLQHRSEAFA